MKRVLVTGGTGVTGTALVRYLLEKKIEVIAIVRPGSFREKYLPDDPGLHIVHKNLMEIGSIADEIKDYGSFDAMFHLAWEGSTISDKVGSRDNMELQSRNIVYTVDAARLCKDIGSPVFVMTGSQAEYGEQGGDISEDISEDIIPAPQNGYGNAKLCAENMTRIMCHKSGVKHICARLFSVYGPYDGTNSLINTSILKLLKGERPQYTKGEQMWNYLYSFDAAKALLFLAEKGKSCESYNVASRTQMPLKEYIRMMHDVVNSEISPIFGEKDYPGGKLTEMRSDISKLVAATGFSEEYSFKQGIEQIMKWCVEFSEEYVGNVENKDFYK
ncbi:NAD-dependent epimerase/dehydratase family protein [Butyrivibrio sp. AD3002]|uniref:NAD-dependent epimerase/dehydratase family protein n=1 Tax=Butyrivibrio sp. AD3002 TaxID=1280670 RepID=UPI0003B6A98B|nr:NAD(P)-dependent oxidoreductase [Butyrivibrio sp. AD3002]